jgi:hypothetical protein
MLRQSDTTYTHKYYSFIINFNMAYLLKARIVKPQETSINREQHGKNTWPGDFYAVRSMFPQQQVCT